MAENLVHDLACFLDSPAYYIPINNILNTFKTICCNTIIKHVSTKWTTDKLIQTTMVLQEDQVATNTKT